MTYCMRLAAYIAGRYLIAKKSHNVINIISAISAAGMAIGTAALIIILSVYNGFDALIRSMMSNVEPDLLITPATGKVFTPDDEAFDWIYDQVAIKNMSCILQEDVFISYDGKQGLAQARGVDWIYEEESILPSAVRDALTSLAMKSAVSLTSSKSLLYALHCHLVGIVPQLLYHIMKHINLFRHLNSEF